MLFDYGCIGGKNAQDAKVFKLSGCGSTICLLCRTSIVGELELDRSVVV
jgi:hypothetical protein